RSSACRVRGCSLPVVWASWKASVAAVATTSVTPSVSGSGLAADWPGASDFLPLSQLATRFSRYSRICLRAADGFSPRDGPAIKSGKLVWQAAHLCFASHAVAALSRYAALSFSDQVFANGSSD